MPCALTHDGTMFSSSSARYMVAGCVAFDEHEAVCCSARKNPTMYLPLGTCAYVNWCVTCEHCVTSMTRVFICIHPWGHSLTQS